MTNYLKKYQRLLMGMFLGFIACFLAVNMAAPSQSINLADTQLLSNESRLINYQEQAESVLLARDFKLAQSGDLKRFSAILSADDVYPNAVSTLSTGAIGAVLNGNRLIVRGDYRGLSSPLRDYATDPLSPPNPKITSGIHIHRGSAKENGPFQYALEIQPESDGLNGRVSGEFTLTDEQLQALNSGGLYVDLHTKSFRAGELRGILKAYQV